MKNVTVKDNKLAFEDTPKEQPKITRRRYLSKKWDVPENEVEKYFPHMQEELDTPVWFMTTDLLPKGVGGVTRYRNNDVKFTSMYFTPNAGETILDITPSGKTAPISIADHEIGHVDDATRTENIGGYKNAPIDSTPAKDEYWAREKEARAGFEAFTTNLVDQGVRLTNEKSPDEFLTFMKMSTHLMDPYTRENFEKLMKDKSPGNTSMFKVLYDSYKRTTPTK